jgi:phosphatidylethanolamine/phosphatidyl-N-methylethanolamine N-methyltransferase
MFLRSVLKNPKRTGALAPSGRTLAQMITGDVALSDKPIIELGPGTGAFTRALLARGIPEHRLILVEANSDFSDELRIRFPRARVLTMDAAHVADVMDVVDGPAGAVVSGLPLVSMPAETVALILEGAFRHLCPDGAFYQFTYIPRCPVPGNVLQRLGLEAERVGCAWANLPPAFVYRLRCALRPIAS